MSGALRVWVIEEANFNAAGLVLVVCATDVAARRWLERRRRMEIRQQKKDAIECGEYDREWRPSVSDLQEGKSGFGRFIRFEVDSGSTTYIAREHKVIT